MRFFLFGMSVALSNLVVLGRTGDGKSTLCRCVALQLGVPLGTATTMFRESSGPASHTHDPVSCSSDPNSGPMPGTTVMDTPGLMDTDGVAKDEENIAKIVRHVRKLASVNAFCLVVNEQANRFDSGMQDAVKLLVDSFGPNCLNNMGIVFTKAYGGVSLEESKKNAAHIAALISRRTGFGIPYIPSWQLDCRPEQLATMFGLPQSEIERRVAQRDATLLELLRWARASNPVDTTGATAAEYEQRRLAREAEEKRKEAEEKRAYDQKVIKTDIEKRSVEYNRTSVPIFRDETRSRQVWKGGMGKMLGQKKTQHWTERVHVGNTVTKFMREEQRKVETLGSGQVIYGEWTTVREWQENA